jgi:hypothetical protein
LNHSFTDDVLKKEFQTTISERIDKVLGIWKDKIKESKTIDAQLTMNLLAIDVISIFGFNQRINSLENGESNMYSMINTVKLKINQRF